jgi:hypothetical protein
MERSCGFCSEESSGLDIAINIMDEPRLSIPWENMKGFVLTEQAQRMVLAPGSLTSKYSGKYKVIFHTTDADNM